MYNYDIQNEKTYVFIISIVLVLFCGLHMTLAGHTGTYVNASTNFFAESYITINDAWIEQITKFRGKKTVHAGSKVKLKDNTIIKKMELNLKKSLLMSWHLIHMFNNFLFGLFVPHWYVPAIIFGILFEIGEYYICNCHDAIDIVFNVIGLIIGIFFNYMIYQTYVQNFFGMKSLYVAIIFAVIVSVLFHAYIFYNIYSYHQKNIKKEEPIKSST